MGTYTKINADLLVLAAAVSCSVELKASPCPWGAGPPRDVGPCSHGAGKLRLDEGLFLCCSRAVSFGDEHQALV